MKNYIINDTIVEYECIGEGTPILFLHGWGMDRWIMSGCFEPIFEIMFGFMAGMILFFS